MEALEQFPNVPDSGIVIRQEGGVVRLFFDIAPAPEMPTEEGETTSGPGDLSECYNVDVPVPANYGNIIAAIVNDKYSADDTQALISNFTEARVEDSDMSHEKREEYIAEWNEFQAWRVKAKEIATAVTNIIQS